MTTPSAQLSATRLCPVCSGPAHQISSFSVDYIVHQLERTLGHSGLREHIHTAYGMHRCSECSLEFSDPMLEPGPGFYQWLTRSGFAYPEQRWEWSACIQWANVNFLSKGDRQLAALDVGCGDGKFLTLLSDIAGIRALGVDQNPDVISICHMKGLQAVIGDLDHILHAICDPVDLVTLWHVVEHVADPLGVLEVAKNLLSPVGVICFSVPLSPMSYEAAWPDPYNAPPHHLTRWNERSLKALASALFMDMELVLPEPDSTLRRSMRALLLEARSGTPSFSRVRKFGLLLQLLFRKPRRLFMEIARQRNAPKLAGRIRPDVALVILKRQSS